MVHTLPDYTTKYKMAKVFGNIDSGELAARLGSINTYDRRGKTIWMDGFEHAILTWNDDGIGAGGSAILSTAAARNGDTSCKIVTGAVAGNEWYIQKRGNYPALSQIGCETSLCIISNDGLYEIHLNIRSTGGLYRGAVQYKKSDNTWYVMDAGGVFRAVSAEGEVSDDTYHFTTAKLVIDYDTKKYVRLMVADNTWDISAYTMRYQPLGGIPFIGVQLLCEAETNNAVTVYVDDVIVTQDEEG